MALPSREARTAQLIRRGIMPSVAERIVAECEANGQRIIPPTEAAEMAKITEADKEEARQWWHYTPDVPQNMRRILDAQTQPADINSAPPYRHPGGNGQPAPGWERVTGKRMTPARRRAIFVDGLVSASNLAASGYVIFSTRAEPTHYVRCAGAICEVPSRIGQGVKALSQVQRQALLNLGFQAPDDSAENFWLDYSARSLDMMVWIIEKTFTILGSVPNCALVVEFDARQPA